MELDVASVTDEKELVSVWDNPTEEVAEGTTVDKTEVPELAVETNVSKEVSIES